MVKITKRLVDEAMKKKRAEKVQYEELSYIRFKNDFKGVERGTVILPNGRVIPAYPHIPRIFLFEKGIKRHFSDKEDFWVEEKIDGYNVRVFVYGKKIYSLSRGGVIEPFTTEKIRDIPGIKGFFNEYSHGVLCGEMIGNTPFTPPVKDYDVRFLIFDIAEKGYKFLEPEKRYSLLRSFSLLGVPKIGRFNMSSLDKLKERLLLMNKGNKEGVVIKGKTSRVKFVFPKSDIQDISESVGIMFDMPTGFFNQRFLRSALFIKEFSLPKDMYAKKLGMAFLKLIEEIDAIKKEKKSIKEFEVLVKDEETFERIRKNLEKGIKIEVIFRRKETKGLRVRFRKIYKKSTKRFNHILSGGSEVD